MALLVPEATRVTRIGLVGALSDHYVSPGRLADYRRQFEKTVWQDGEDPSKFAVALETLAVKAFGDIGPNAGARPGARHVSIYQSSRLYVDIW